MDIGQDAETNVILGVLSGTRQPVQIGQKVNLLSSMGPRRCEAISNYNARERMRMWVNQERQMNMRNHCQL